MKKFNVLLAVLLALAFGTATFSSCSKSETTPSGACASAPMLGSWKLTGVSVTNGGTLESPLPSTVVSGLAAVAGIVTYNSNCTGKSGADAFTYSVSGNKLTVVEKGTTATTDFVVSGLNLSIKSSAAQAAASSDVSLSDLSTGLGLTGPKALVASDIVVYIFSKQ
jgi:hypothetical protein